MCVIRLTLALVLFGQIVALRQKRGSRVVQESLGPRAASPDIISLQHNTSVSTDAGNFDNRSTLANLPHCELDSQELVLRDFLASPKLKFPPIQANGVHALPGECVNPDPSLGRDVNVRQLFGVPNKIRGPIVEVGSNIGYDLSLFLKNYPDAQVYAFEPIPELAYQLERQEFVRAAGKRVHIIEYGMGSKTESIKFHKGSDGSEASSSFDAPEAQGVKTKKLPVISLPDALFHIEDETGQSPEAISFNCEGCEYPSLLSFVTSPWLGKVRYIQFSWHIVNMPERVETRCRVESALRQAGYELVYFSYYGWQGWALPCKAR